MAEVPGSHSDGEKEFVSEAESTELEQYRHAVHKLLAHTILLGSTGQHDYSEDAVARRNEATREKNLLSEKIPIEDQIRIANEEKINILNLPSGMNLSPKAMELVEQRWSTYRTEFAETSSLSEKQKEEAGRGIRWSYDGKLALCYKGDTPVGVSTYEVLRDETSGRPYMHVTFQTASRDEPGAGLSMLDQLVMSAKEQGLSYVTLETKKQPLGLGNLGFHFVPEDEKWRAMDSWTRYRLDLDSTEVS